MENNLNGQNDRPIRSSSSPMSVEERMRQSMKGISQMGGVSSGEGVLSGGTNSSYSSAKKDNKDDNDRKKVGGVVLDMDLMEGAQRQTFDTKGRRNNVIIVVLSLMLVASIAFLFMAINEYKKGSRKPNLIYTMEGEAEWIVMGNSNMTEIVLADGLYRDMVYLIDSDIKVNTTKSVSIRIEIEVLLEGAPLLINDLDFQAHEWERTEGTNIFTYYQSVVGGGMVEVFEGIDFSYAPYNLNSNNVVITVKGYVTLDPVQEPEDPDNPDNPEDPDNPDNPDNPDEPTDPDNPDEPTDPDNPDNPDEPTDPDNPDNPDNPDEPTDPDDDEPEDNVGGDEPNGDDPSEPVVPDDDETQVPEDDELENNPVNEPDNTPNDDE